MAWGDALQDVFAGLESVAGSKTLDTVLRITGKSPVANEIQQQNGGGYPPPYYQQPGSGGIDTKTMLIAGGVGLGLVLVVAILARGGN